MPVDLIHEAVAAKVMGAWIANRHQTLMPLAINFRRLDEGAGATLIRCMGSALLAAGPPTDAALTRARAWLNTVGGTEATAAALDAALADPTSLPVLLARLEADRLGPAAFAVCVAVLDQRVTANRLFIDYLAARLALPSDMARSLSQRYRT